MGSFKAVSTEHHKIIPEISRPYVDLLVIRLVVEFPLTALKTSY